MRLVNFKKDTKELNHILNKWDFIGVLPFEGGPKDEYDCLVPPTLHLLNKGTEEEELASFFNKELDQHFGVNPKLCHTEKIAKEIVQWWSGLKTSI